MERHINSEVALAYETLRERLANARANVLTAPTRENLNAVNSLTVEFSEIRDHLLALAGA